MNTQDFCISGASPIYRIGLLHALQRECLPSFEGASRSDVGLQILVASDQPSWPELEKLTRQLRADRPALILGGPIRPSVARKLLAAGVQGYILSNAPAEKLRTATERIRGGGVYLDPDLQDRKRTLRPLIDPLTKRERQVLRLIVLEYTTHEIAGKLFISRCTVETHRAHILQKLGVRNTAGIVREAMRRELCAV